MNPDMEKAKTNLKRVRVVAIVLLSGLAAGVLVWHVSQPAHGQARASIWVRSASFSAGGSIPRQYTCDGGDLSPQLEWQPAPDGTKSFAIVMEDPDAPFGFTHWLVYNVAPGVHELPQGASTHAASHQGAAEGTNSFGRLGYGGPCPPRGNPHHYVFTVYALNVRLDLPAGATRKQVDAAIGGHVVAQGQVVGTYQRTSQ